MGASPAGFFISSRNKRAADKGYVGNSRHPRAASFRPPAIRKDLSAGFSCAAIRRLRAAGAMLPAVAAELDRRRIRTKEGRPWMFTTIQGILNRAA